MKRLSVAVFAILLVGAVSFHAVAQRQFDPDFKRFWGRFRTAVVKNDKEAIASMTRLPFLFDSKERNREQFIRIQHQLFTRKIRRCFATVKPLPEGENYDVFCGELIFYFGKVEGEYKLIEFGVND